MRHAPAATILLLGAAACGAAEPAYLGHWVPDASQTDLSNITIQYEVVDSMTYRVTVDGQTYLMPTDGSEAETPWGGTMAVQQLDSLSWESIFRVGGNVIGTDTLRLSADGATLEVRGHRAGADGADEMSETRFQRVAGGPGLAGTWSGASTSGGMIGDLTIAASGDSALAITFASMQADCTPNLNGADAVATSPMFDGTWTCAVAEREDGGLTLTWKRSGEPRYISEYTVSANGDTLTEVSTAAEVNEPVTVVYTRSGEEH